MRLTKKLVREIINKCWKRGYNNRSFTVPSYIFISEQIKNYLDNIKIEFDNSNTYMATMSCTGKKNKYKFVLTVSLITLIL